MITDDNQHQLDWNTRQYFPHEKSMSECRAKYGQMINEMIWMTVVISVDDRIQKANVGSALGHYK
jgi:hypothetical protein